jgi:hypothetical protein
MTNSDKFSAISRFIFSQLDFEKFQNNWVKTSESDFKAFYESFQSNNDLPCIGALNSKKGHVLPKSCAAKFLKFDF